MLPAAGFTPAESACREPREDCFATGHRRGPTGSRLSARTNPSLLNSTSVRIINGNGRSGNTCTGTSGSNDCNVVAAARRAPKK